MVITYTNTTLTANNAIELRFGVMLRRINTEQ